MAKPRSQNRQRADKPSRVNIDRPAKKGKTRSELELDAWESWVYPPQFYDRLSSISLTHRALQELDRRTASRRSRLSPPARPSDGSLSRAVTRGLARFAENCPDLRDLRGYPHPPVEPLQLVAMSASPSRSSDPTLPASTRPTSSTTTTKKSGPYDRNFEVHLTENAIHPTWRSRKPDLEDIRAALAAPRPSLSPSRFPEAAFEAFQESNARAKDEEDVMANIIPTILGPSQTSRFCARNTVFGNLEPLTDDSITAAKPDIYYGAYPEQLARPARNELAGHTVPSTMLDKPTAPNVFFEIKGPDDIVAMVTRQARYDGAIGSRAMHSLQNYGAEQPRYDGKAYTFSFTYYAGALYEYAHHVTAPTTEGGPPEYHMTVIKGYVMTNDLETYIEGAGALRNTLDLAEQYRDTFIRAANAKASQPKTASSQEHADAMRPPEDLADELAPSPACYTTRTQHEEDQRQEDSPDELALSPPRYLYAGDDSQDSPEVGASTSLTTSFTSSFGPNQSRSKRQRSPYSQAAERPTSKTRSRSTRGAGTLKPAAESFQVQTFWKRGKLCFLDAQEQEVKTELQDWMERKSDDGRKYFSWRSPESERAFWTAALAVKPRKRRSYK